MSLIATDATSANNFDDFHKSVHGSGSVKRGLPSFAYTDEKFWQQEKNTLFPNSWVLVGFAHEIDKPGDVVPVNIGDSPILLVRGRDDVLKAFHNVCSHRCLKLVDSPKNVGRVIQCPYHTWVYGLDGELRVTPYFGGDNPRAVPEGFDPKEYGLKEVNCVVWHDWVFVNVSGDAQSFGEFVAPLSCQLEGLDLSKAKLVGVIDLGEIETNWKFLMENFIEPYHVQFVHNSTTDQPLVDHYTIDDNGCRGSAVDLDEGGDQNADTLAVSSRFLTLFPNFVFGRYFPDQIGVHLNIPVGPDKTMQRRAIYTTDGSELDRESAEKLMQLWIDVHKEDHEMCVRLQKGRKSSIAEKGGVLSPKWENSVRSFQERVVAAVSPST